MLRTIRRLIGAIALTLCAISAHATLIPVGYMSWDLNIPGSTGAFDISNMTGINVSDPDFPISTSVSLGSLSLTVHFVTGPAQTFGSSYFTLSSDGISFNGGDIPIGGANPLPIDATLTGTFSPTTITVIGDGTQTILSDFSATITPSAGRTLSDGDLAIINATTCTPTAAGGCGTTTVPEPGSLMLLGLGALAMSLRLRRRCK